MGQSSAAAEDCDDYDAYLEIYAYMMLIMITRVDRAGESPTCF